VAYGSYRLIASGSGIASRRRVVAAAVAGYLAVNAAALAAAVEFGIQPVLFHDARGTPLYAPYPLSVAIPAMMIGHLTFAGLAEAVITAGVVAYLQVADPTLLRSTSGLSLDAAGESLALRPAAGSLRRLWIAVAALMLLTPLGILAAGTAWGEWSPSELAKTSAQSQLAKSTTNPLPVVVPSGLQKLANLWTAPFPAYAPGFVKSRGFGYLLSAMFAVGVLLALSLLLQRWGQRRARAEYSG
jgi:cobalt/nickel transport system permease protein